MAITFRNPSTTVNSTAGTSISLAMPTGVVQNDVMVAVLAWNPVVGQTVTVVPSGWSLWGTVNSGYAVYTKVAGAGEAGPYAWTIGTSKKNASAIVAYSGCDTSTPQDQQVAGSTVPTTLSCTIPSITPARSGAMELCVALAGAGGNSWTPPGSCTERVDISTTASSPISLEISEILLAGTGATGTRTATATVTGTTQGVALTLSPPLTTDCIMSPWGIAEPL